MKSRNHSQTSKSDFEEDFEFSKNSNASKDDASDDDENDEEQWAVDFDASIARWQLKSSRIKRMNQTRLWAISLIF